MSQTPRLSFVQAPSKSRGKVTPSMPHQKKEASSYDGSEISFRSDDLKSLSIQIRNQSYSKHSTSLASLEDRRSSKNLAVGSKQHFGSFLSAEK